MKQHIYRLFQAWGLGMVIVVSALLFRHPAVWLVIGIGTTLVVGALVGLFAISVENWREGREEG